MSGVGEVKFLNRNNPVLTEAEVRKIAMDLYGLSGEFTPLKSERDQNYRIKMPSAELCVLKISNVNEDHGVIDFQTKALLHIQERDPLLPVPRVIRNKKAESISRFTAENGDEHLLHVLSYLPGELLKDSNLDMPLWHGLGVMMGKVDAALSNFFHPHAAHEIVWDMKRCTALKEHTRFIEDAQARKNIDNIFRHMESVIIPRFKHMRQQVIHSDAHNDNVLCCPHNRSEVTGLLDFGDMHYAVLPGEIAIAADFEFIDRQHYVDALCALSKGYDSIVPLQECEIDSIYDLVLCRYAMIATVVAWRDNAVSNQPAYYPNSPAAKIIAALLAEGREKVRARLRKACGFPVYCEMTRSENPPVADNVDGLMARRHTVLSENLEHFYKEPLHIERGRGSFLYDVQGRAYLDCYNNVPVVGHCHPRVVNAVSRQLAALNTNTRYIYENILTYAERLCATLPAQLSVCLFVNSGSEANDVAWQIAQFTSKKRGAIVMENAYHGISEVIAQLSPYAMTAIKRHVATLTSPDSYRGEFKAGGSNLAEKYARDADRCIRELDEKDLGSAAFMIDSTFMSNGIPDVPAGYVAQVAQKVRAAGGLIIADEVQSGFGRMGEMWGFNVQGFMPDIVTLGKPVGNGFPLGVVITTAEILNAFTEATGLFSTFGGNPVACAAGMAVLDVIEDENLISSAKQTGDYLRAGLRELMGKFPVIGDVRGCGLLAGIELVKDPVELVPAVTETRQLIELMRDNGVLIGKEGRLNNVLKIRPPMVMTKQHADIFLQALDKSLAAL